MGFNENEELTSKDHFQVTENVQDAVDKFLEDFEVSMDEFKELKNSVQETNEAPISLEEAVLDFQAGNEKAFDYLYHHYERPINNLGRRMHNDELPSELFEVLLRAASRFDVTYKAKFNTYFWRCAQNHIGSQRNMRLAQKRGGVKETNKVDPTVELDVEQQREFYKNDEQLARIKTVSLNHQALFKYGNDSVEIMDFVEDEASVESFEQTALRLDLENLLSSGLLKPKEVAAINLIRQNPDITLEEAGKKLGNITAPAVHVLLRRIQNKAVATQLREILAR